METELYARLVTTGKRFKVQFDPSKVRDVEDLIKKMQTTIPRTLGDFDVVDISLHLTDNSPCVDSTDSLEEIVKKNTKDKPIYVKAPIAAAVSALVSCASYQPFLLV